MAGAPVTGQRESIYESFYKHGSLGEPQCNHRAVHYTTITGSTFWYCFKCGELLEDDKDER